MVNESRTFGAAVLLALAGLGTLLYGVSLDNGMSMNLVMAAGGATLFTAIAVHTAGIMLLGPEGAEA
jgi:hypothetical protein